MQTVLLYLATLLFAALAEVLYLAFLGPLCRKRTWLQFLFGILVCLLISWPATLLTLQGITIAARTGSGGPSLSHLTVFFFFIVYALAWTAVRSSLVHRICRHLVRRQERRACVPPPRQSAAPAQKDKPLSLAGVLPLPRFLYPGELPRLLGRRKSQRASKGDRGGAQSENPLSSPQHRQNRQGKRPVPLHSPPCRQTQRLPFPRLVNRPHRGRSAAVTLPPRQAGRGL